ncbi:hypothetical protein BVG79_p1000172 (plasmid) [Ketogulonicigenium robustum]|uniref:Uncharacterized protein n=1 Tax=Ketogulonicigenium robustum TaxID=92947 RepID=A0A1W6P3F4_9RHOB|nr:hypothetical protein BVG79_p1000172 [Ketogulonicigenium robustum]
MRVIGGRRIICIGRHIEGGYCIRRMTLVADCAMDAVIKVWDTRCTLLRACKKAVYGIALAHR